MDHVSGHLSDVERRAAKLPVIRVDLQPMSLFLPDLSPMATAQQPPGGAIQCAMPDCLDLLTCDMGHSESWVVYWNVLGAQNVQSPHLA